MSWIREGLPASPGISCGPAWLVRYAVPRVPRGSGISAAEVEREIAAFHEAREWAQDEIRELQARTEERLGPVEARIFEPQLLMLEDPELVDRTVSYIRENHLDAARAFEWRMLEWESQWSHTSHPMVLDKLNDLADVQARVLRRLLGLAPPDLPARPDGDGVILVAREITPSLAVQLDPERVLGIATDLGTRTSHASILARSLEIPAVVSLGDLSTQLQGGEELILDGRAGRVIAEPTEEETVRYRERDFRFREWEQELLLLAHLEPVTRDGVRVALRANIDLPGEAESARAHGGEGVGLFRTEFLVVGRSAAPSENEQYEAYRSVAEVFPHSPVVIRTYDLGGDKFPTFLHMAPEENPFLGWRAIRVCLDEPELFRDQLRALLRARAHGDVRIMLPLVNEIGEVLATRELLEEEAQALRSQDAEFVADYILGAMIETPAAAMLAPELAGHVDFFSIGTNDLVQYTLAVDRGNSRLAKLYNPFHPAVIRLLDAIVRAGRTAGIEVGVCGEMAANPLAAFLLIGMGVDSLSVGPSSLAEIKKVIRSVTREAGERAVRAALSASTPDAVLEAVTEVLGESADPLLFGGPVGLPAVK
ncbi:phosphoenolpyruvate--protein phosphotransferase [soil metagenome]